MTFQQFQRQAQHGVQAPFENVPAWVGWGFPFNRHLFCHDLDAVDEQKHTTFPLIPQRICTKGWILNMFNGHPNTQKSQ